MDTDVADLVTGVNYEEVDALSQKRIITFFNEFVSQTVTLLNNFSTECEEKLFDVDTRLEKLETMLSILETKLSSVPGLSSQQKASDTAVNGIEAPKHGDATQPDLNQSPTGNTTNSQSAAPPQSDDQMGPGQPAGDQSSGLVRLRQTEPYRRYFRMLEVGVPEPAVRIKMTQEGVDPDVLQRGDELVPERAEEGSDAGSWSSGSSAS